jgi:hypothetical protein
MCCEDIRNGTDGQLIQTEIAVRRFNHDLVGADAGKIIVETDRVALQCALDLHRRVTVRHHAHAPARFIGARGVVPHGVDFMGRQPFVPAGEGIEVAALHDRRSEILRAALALRGKNDPGMVQRITSKFRGHAKRQ